MAKHDYILCNRGFTIDYYKKFTKDDIKKFGISPKLVLEKLNDDIELCDAIIGHNIAFDIRKLNIYCDSFGLKFNCPKQIIDTMSMSRNIVNAKCKNNRIKNPKLIEVCNFFKLEIKEEEFHDAFYDVDCTLQCYIKLLIYQAENK